MRLVSHASLLMLIPLFYAVTMGMLLLGKSAPTVVLLKM